MYERASRFQRPPAPDQPGDRTAFASRRAAREPDGSAPTARARLGTPRPNPAMLAYLDARRLGPLGADAARRGSSR